MRKIFVIAILMMLMSPMVLAAGVDSFISTVKISKLRPKGENGEFLGVVNGSAAWLPVSPGVNTIFSRHVVNGQIMSVDLANGGVINTKIGANAVSTDKILNGTILAADVSSSFISNNGKVLLDDAQFSDMRNTLGLGNVENTALSTWAGSSNITTVGTIGTGEWSGTAINIGNGGTGATSASGARTNLGLAIGTNVQAFSSNLSLLSAFAYTNGDLITTVNGGQLKVFPRGANHCDFTINGTRLACEADSAGGGGTPGGADTEFQFNDTGAFGGNGALAFTKGTKTLAIAADAPLDINSTTVSIADTDITLDGASTTFTNANGFINLKANTNTGISDYSPDFLLDVNGTLGATTASVSKLLSSGSVNGANLTASSGITGKRLTLNGNTLSIPSLTQGSLLVATTAGTLRELTKGTNKNFLAVNGNKLTYDTAARATNNLSFFAATTSAQLAGVLSDETGTSKAVFNGSPSITSPTITSATLNRTTTINGNTASLPVLAQGSLLVVKSTGSIKELAKGTNHYALKVNGNALAWEADSTGSGNIPTINKLAADVTSTDSTRKNILSASIESGSSYMYDIVLRATSSGSWALGFNGNNLSALNGSVLESATGGVAPAADEFNKANNEIGINNTRTVVVQGYFTASSTGTLYWWTNKNGANVTVRAGSVLRVQKI